jgi:hypothetical protein
MKNKDTEEAVKELVDAIFLWASRLDKEHIVEEILTVVYKHK